MYAAVKAATLVLAFQSQAPWYKVIVTVWDADDFALFNMIVSFWFIGRSIEKYQK